jgi:hypothetical protein
MPRFFFHCEGALEHRDSEGTELADIPAARLQAIDMAGQLLRDHPHDMDHPAAWRLFVNDSRGGTVFAMRIEVERAA